MLLTIVTAYFADIRPYLTTTKNLTNKNIHTDKHTYIQSVEYAIDTYIL